MHKLLTEKPGDTMLLLGNEAIARGAIEAGLAFAASYPGTPSSEISLNFFQMSKESDLYFEYSVNEKVSLEAAAAAANCGVRSMCIMKHVGLNVASDALMTLAYVGVKAGMVVLVADDPYMFSSQNEQDNRFFGKLSGLPILEPSSVQEAKEMITYAFDLSEDLQEPVIFRTTTRINHSTAIVELGDLTKPMAKGEFVKDPFNYVTVPAVSRNLHVTLLENIKVAQGMANDCRWNFVEGSGSLGVICNGVSYAYVKDSVRELSKENEIKIFRMGFSHPLPNRMVKDFLKNCTRVLVVEEGEPYMEEAVKACAQEEGLTLPIAGKGEDLFSRLYEFDPLMVKKVIASYFEIPFNAPEAIDLSDVPDIPGRPPTLCAGCSHRAVFYAVKQATQGLDVIHPSDIGCYTLGFLPPLSMGDFVICMGASTGTTAGFATVTGQKVISFIGDSTFFHSGIAGLINAVFNNHDITLIILDNRTTAMTGHQPNPGVDMDELSFTGYNSLDIEQVVRGLGVGHVSVMKPYKLAKSIETIKEAIAHKGVSVIIAKEKCTLYAKSLKQLHGKAFEINQEKCKDHRDCITSLACPAFYLDEGRVMINASMCTGCSVCAQVCPEKAIRPVKTPKP